MRSHQGCCFEGDKPAVVGHRANLDGLLAAAWHPRNGNALKLSPSEDGGRISRAPPSERVCSIRGNAADLPKPGGERRDIRVSDAVGNQKIFAAPSKRTVKRLQGLRGRRPWPRRRERRYVLASFKRSSC